jgi:iron complex transport system permease protein
VTNASTAIGPPATTSRGSARRAAVGLAALLAAGACASLAVGATSVPIGTAIDAVVSFDAGTTEHLVVRELRLPRTLLAIVVGGALGVAGALMQGVTRNPLADPGLLGVNAGAAFAVVVGIWSFDVHSTTGQVWFAMVGAAIASLAVYVLGGGGSGTPVRLALAGAALGALLFALTRAITLLDQATLDQFRFWAVGSLSGADLGTVRRSVGFVVVGVVLAVGVSRRLDAIALGDTTAGALGTRVRSVRAVAVVAITLLCGTAVAVAGPIAFVGLIVPHAVRWWSGPDHRSIVSLSALAGAALLVIGDTVGRVIGGTGEVQVGIVTVLLGGPVFVMLVRRPRLVAL